MPKATTTVPTERQNTQRRGTGDDILIVSQGSWRLLTHRLIPARTDDTPVDTTVKLRQLPRAIHFSSERMLIIHRKDQTNSESADKDAKPRRKSVS